MGLLDGFFSDDPQKQAQMALALGLLSGNGGKGLSGFARNLGQAGMGAMQTYAFGSENQRRNKLADMQNQMHEFQLGQQKKAAEDQAYAAQIAPQFFGQGNAPADGVGPALPPKADFTGYGQALMARNPALGMPWIQAGQKDNTPLILAPGAKAVDKHDYRTLADNPKNELPSGMRMGPNGPEWVPGYIKGQQEIRAAGKTDVTTNIMPPREIFKDSLSLKKDFDGQPEVKGFKEVQSAWDQISTALQKPSPANDMAAATKFMKLLDPGSVVRESELMMAMQASGAWDRFMNTADRVLKGVKLTPQQREDFYKAGEALYQASLDRYGQTVNQYEGIAKQYGLDSQFVQNAKPRKKNGGWSIQRAD